MRPLTAVTLALLVGSVGGCASHVEGPSPELRLRRIVLYQNGIGYFERTGTLPDGRLRMQFRDREVDDVLKSLVVVEEGLDAAHEKPSTVSVRLSNRAKEAADDSSSSLDLLLSRRVPRRMSIAYEVPTAIWKATYRVILPDAQTTEHPGMALVQAWALIDNASDEDWNAVQVSLATGAPLSFSTDLRTPQFIDRPTVGSAPPPLANGAVVSENGRAHDRDGDGIPDKEDKCPDASGNGDDGCPRRVTMEGEELRILQQVQFPRDSDAVPSASGPVLDEIAGVLKQRPSLALQLEGHASAGEKDPWVVAARRAGAVRAALEARGVRAKLTIQSFGDTRPLVDGASEDGRRKNRRVEFRVVEGFRADEANEPVEHFQASQVSGGPGAATHEVAGAVRYEITDPVTIARHSSNLVTIVNRYVSGEDVLLFRPDPSVPSSTTHPFRAARLDNKEGLELQAGSVAIFSGGTFVGEGLLAHLNPGETTLVPYAVDGATEVRSSVDQARKPLRIVAIARGVLTVEDTDTVTTTYEASVGAQAPARLVIRHPRRGGFAATGLPPSTEAGPDAYVIPLPVRAATHSRLVVEETRTERRELRVLDTAAATLGLYAQGSGLPPELDKHVHELMVLRGELDRRDEEIGTLREGLLDASARAGELRESLRAVEKTPHAGAIQKQLLERLAQATRQIEEQAAALADKTAAQSVARGRLNEAVRDLRLGDPPR